MIFTIRQQWEAATLDQLGLLWKGKPGFLEGPAFCETSIGYSVLCYDDVHVLRNISNISSMTWEKWRNALHNNLKKR